MKPHTCLPVAAALMMIVLAAVPGVTAAGLAPEAPISALESAVKFDDHVGARPAADGREGGEDIATAVMIPALPYTDTGATCEHLNDYAWMCPYGNWAPDVVYGFDVPDDMLVTIDLCGSLYDTLLFVFTPDVELIACNDDFYFDEECGYYVSKIELLPVSGGETIYIAVDGYTSDCGEYLLAVDGSGAIATERGTWSSVKARYR